MYEDLNAEELVEFLEWCDEREADAVAHAMENQNQKGEEE